MLHCSVLSVHSAKEGEVGGERGCVFVHVCMYEREREGEGTDVRGGGGEKEREREQW